jgi:mono/diheme cytochrome c family protein
MTCVTQRLANSTLLLGLLIWTTSWTGLAHATDAPKRWYDEATRARGAPLYRRYCASCHGARAEGHPNWRQSDTAGRLPPPPLNGTAHTWHPPSRALLDVIQNGSPGGFGNMPAWKDIPKPAEIAAVIAWVQSLWSDEIYARWIEIDRAATRK